MIDRLREQIHQYLDQLADEAERLRKALTALDPRSSKSPARKAPAQKAARTSAPRRNAPPATAPPAAPATRTPRRTAPGSTRASVLAALAGGEAMTASEVATKAGIARPTVATTLSRLAQTGEVQKAQRGYQLSPVGGSTDAAPVTAPSAPSTPKKPRARRAPQAKPSPSAETSKGRATPEATAATETATVLATAATPEPKKPRARRSPRTRPTPETPQQSEQETSEPTPSAETATTVVDVAATPESPGLDATTPAAPQAALPTPEPAAPAPSTEAASPAGEPAVASPRRTPNGTTTASVLAALTGGEAMTASQVAAKAGLARPTVSTTLSKLAKSGAVEKADRGYRLPSATSVPGA